MIGAENTIPFNEIQQGQAGFIFEQIKTWARKSKIVYFFQCVKGYHSHDAQKLTRNLDIQQGIFWPYPDSAEIVEIGFNRNHVVLWPYHGM